ncbi:hypothetical protein BJ508DRAFT_416577 [Ascobolus immersus RN42]|uniref:F-box domain-containing protein n=1 Tax=Ascobolus immersus RN42 TaxID=1160509 RepID=A0A3N4I2D2_ASCIM|nr:hypothetical protein BJ508DRAFT_416577 [Ascobolus immersus RN42]
MLQLPVEIRLEIYRHLTVLTLLQLTQTHPKLRAEIRSTPKLYTSSRHYDPCYRIAAETDGHTRIDPNPGHALTKADIYSLADEEELRLWQRLYHRGWITKQQCCERCLEMSGCDTIKADDGLSESEFLDWDSVCFDCQYEEERAQS